MYYEVCPSNYVNTFFAIGDHEIQKAIVLKNKLLDPFYFVATLLCRY